MIRTMTDHERIDMSLYKNRQKTWNQSKNQVTKGGNHEHLEVIYNFTHKYIPVPVGV